MALNDFTCRSGGNDLNAGTLDGVAEAATTPLVSYLSGSYDASTNAFTPASGNPVNDGVAVGHWLGVTDPNPSLRVPGVGLANASAPDSVATSITGDIDLRVKCRLDKWNGPSSNQLLLSKWDTSSQSYLLMVDTGNISKLRFQWSATGAGSATAVSNATFSFLDGSIQWVRVTLDVDNGAAGNTVAFYTSFDGVTWTQLGTSLVTAGVTSIFDSAIPTTVGSQNDGNTSAGNFYYAEVRNGIAGTVVASPSFESQVAGTTSFADAQGNTWTVGGAASIVAATTVGLSAKITARNSATITLDPSVRFGGVTTGTRDGRVGGAWRGMNGASGHPLTFVSGGYVTEARINLKNDQTYAITTTIIINAAGPTIIQGYTSTFNDKGRFVLDGGSPAGTSYSLLNFNGSNWQMWDFVAQNNGTGGGANGVSLVNVTVLGRGKVSGMRRAGIATSNNIIYLRDVEVTTCNNGGSGGVVNIQTTAVLERCNIHDNPGAPYGVVLATAGDWLAMYDCTVYKNGGDGVASTGAGNALYLFNCDLYGNTGAGVLVSGASGTSRLVAENCNFVANGGYGVNAAGAGQRTGRLTNCGFGSGTAANTSGTTNAMRGIDEENSVTYGANLTPWSDPANGNFTITLAAAKAAGRGNIPTAGVTTSAPAIGAQQPASATGATGTGKVLTSGSCT